MTFTKQSSKTTQKLLTVLLAAGLVLAPAGAFTETANAASAMITKPANIEVDSQTVTWEFPPFVQNGTTFAPLRQAAVALKGKVKWNQSTQTVQIENHGDLIFHKAGTNIITINDVKLTLPANSKNMSGTLMIPLRSLSDAMKSTLQLTNTSTLMNIVLKSDQVTKINKDLVSIDSYLQTSGFSGIALVAKDGEVTLSKGYGLSKENALVRPDQKSRIASITKGFTSAAIMQQVEAGKLSLTDKLSKYVTGVDRGDEITLHMLLSHTSGLPSNFTREEGITLEDTLKEIRTKKLMAEPGAEYRYSNNGYILLAHILEKVTGEEYGSYLQKHIFTPLGMKDTGTAVKGTNTIKGFVDQSGKWVPADYYVSQSGTGTLYSTVDDLLKWDQALKDGKVVSEESLKNMFTPYSEKNYGYGWMISETSKGLNVFHNGSGTGYSTGIMRDLGNGVTIVLLGNHASMDTIGMMNEIRKQVIAAK
ncbi:serine hydrolase [Paenibacillus sp. An7]|uniref:serine hydrolase n=1 Tax=Paenibacillus sp. An7 TaxID=2689577 RepID=UPI00135B65A4|nr:serine hydrolase [Paenibacillus sp. An7]